MFEVIAKACTLFSWVVVKNIFIFIKNWNDNENINRLIWIILSVYHSWCMSSEFVELTFLCTHLFYAAGASIPPLMHVNISNICKFLSPFLYAYIWLISRQLVLRLEVHVKAVIIPISISGQEMASKAVKYHITLVLAFRALWLFIFSKTNVKRKKRIQRGVI